MGITPSALTGNITTSAMQTELDRVRTWLNTGIVVGDLAATGITRQSIYRPNVYGFPLQGSEGVVQDVWGVSQCVETAAARPGVRSNSTGRHFIAQTFGRTSIFPDSLYAESTFRVGKLSKRFVLDVASTVDISCHFEAIVATKPATAGVDVYPAAAGTWSIQYKEVGGATASRITGSRRRATSHGTNVADAVVIRMNLYQTGGQLSLAAGTWDVWLQYDRQASTTGVMQVVLGVASLKIEVHKT